MASLSPHSSPVNSPSEPKSPGRRASFGFLHRSKSKDPLPNRKSSGGKISKKHHDPAREEELRRLQAASMGSQGVPKLPDLEPSPQLQSFGDEASVGKGPKPSLDSTGRNVPIPPVPGKTKSPQVVDPYSRTESMTHRGRYSYAPSAVSTIDSPRRVRRRKDPTPYNVLVVGARNSGKTSFLNFLRSSLTPKKSPMRHGEEAGPTAAAAKANRNFTHHYLETEFDGERVGLTLWDSSGLEKNVVDLQLREVSSFIESKFEETFSEEMKVLRSPNLQDTHIHCVFLILDPIRLDANINAASQQMTTDKTARARNKSARIAGALDEDFDLQVLRILQGKTSVVPVISKADTITTAHMAFLKRMVHDSLKRTGINPLEALGFGADSDLEEESSSATPNIDEHDEDAERVRKSTAGPGPDTGHGSPHTSDSETAPQPQPTPKVPRRHSQRQSLTDDDALFDTSFDAPYLPYSILSPDPYSLEPGAGPPGRKFPWGFADPHNPEHCDFVKLKESCFREWRADFREASKEVWYERWRTSRLKRHGMGGKPNGVNTAKRVSSGVNAARR